MILGIGLIFGVHVVHSMLENPQATLFQQSTGPAVALSGLTTIIGFATLLGAAHRGVASFGFVMSVGVAANLITSLFLLPCLMRWLGQARSTGKTPHIP
jgi:predicted RND superfamily exporter protein